MHSNTRISAIPAGSTQETVYRHVQETTDRVAASSAWITPLKNGFHSVIAGQEHLLDTLLISLLTGGHLLLEGVPGLAKTLAVKTLAQLIGTDYTRIQFTPDILSSDIVGRQIDHPGNNTFNISRGPIFSSLLLADQLNRAPFQVQSALLEAMQERHVTIGTTTYALPELFLVLATQNPCDQEGTYPLPEAQLDRFMLKVVITYPDPETERLILDMKNHVDFRTELEPITTTNAILASRAVVDSIHLDDKIKDYIVAFVCATRDPEAYGLDLAPYIESGASPRATINLKEASCALAYLAGRGFVTPDDVKGAAIDVLRHRIRVSFEAEAAAIGSEEVIRTILDTIPVP